MYGEDKLCIWNGYKSTKSNCYELFMKKSGLEIE